MPCCTLLSLCFSAHATGVPEDILRLALQNEAKLSHKAHTVTSRKAGTQSTSPAPRSCYRRVPSVSARSQFYLVGSSASPSPSVSAEPVSCNSKQSETETSTETEKEKKIKKFNALEAQLALNLKPAHRQIQALPSAKAQGIKRDQVYQLAVSNWDQKGERKCLQLNSKR